tara:strand:+ start:481 stop:864 length:384 start_codon:yes stop_codon:yes gene_type:complete
MEIAILLSGIVAGIIFFQTSIIAPTVFKTLGPEEAKVFLRTVFPKLFNILVTIGFLMITLFFLGIGNIYVAIISIILPFICSRLVNATNKARDTGDTKTFHRLHSLSVVLTMIVLLANLSWLILALI